MCKRRAGQSCGESGDHFSASSWPPRQGHCALTGGHVKSGGDVAIPCVGGEIETDPIWKVDGPLLVFRLRLFSWEWRAIPADDTS